jgi:hypothetical protein
MGIQAIIAFLKNPAQWYRNHNLQVEREAREYTQALFEKNLAALCTDCEELETLLEDNPFQLEALTAFSGEADNRFQDPHYAISANNRHSAFNGEVLTNRARYEQRVGRQTINEWINMYHRFTDSLETLTQRNQAKQRSQQE